MASDRRDVRFFKLSGGGNDFIAVIDREFLTPEHADALCAHGHSLGADGMFSIEPIEPIGDSAPARVRMTYLNADGTRAGLCVNGTRCAALLAFHLGWAIERVTLETDAGAIEAQRTGEQEVALELAPPRLGPLEQTVEVDDKEITGWFVDTGVPHFVLEWDETLLSAPVFEWGAEIRNSPEFEAGANVDFVRFVDRGRIEIRTYERGVEGETLACGTGVLAAAAVAVRQGRADLPLSALTSGGCLLSVEGTVGTDRSIDRWTLAGDARLVAEGVLGAGALTIPDAPLWTD